MAIIASTYWCYYKTKARPFLLIAFGYLYLLVVRFGTIFDQSWFDINSQNLVIGNTALVAAGYIWLAVVFSRWYNHDGSRH